METPEHVWVIKPVANHPAVLGAMDSLLRGLTTVEDCPLNHCSEFGREAWKLPPGKGKGR
jgi:hypothetical protein